MADWDKIVHSLMTCTGHNVVMDPSKYDAANNGYKEIFDLWISKNVDPASVRWTNYYPGKDFDQSIVDEIAGLLNVTPMRSWISRVDSGFQAPWHYDVDDNEEEYLSHGTLRRFSAFILPAELGQVFTIKEHSYVNEEAGNLYEWDDYRDWHEAKNTGTTPHFMFHILGVSCT